MAQYSSMFSINQTVGSVPCCICGTYIAFNSATMCVKCLQSREDITEGLPKLSMIQHCAECDTYLHPPGTWIKAQLESKELLAFCVNKLHLKNKGVRLVQADFVWTEPHSKRIKVKLRVQKEVLNGVILEQAYVVEYVVQDQMCERCSRSNAHPDQWVGVVQLRQHVSHRRGFLYLEQLILRHDAASRAIRIKQLEEGIDFFFGHEGHAHNFVYFIANFAPIKHRKYKQLVSHDTKSSTYNYTYTFSVEICPIFREDLICLPSQVAKSAGNLGPLVICTKVTSSIAFLDPFTLGHCSVEANRYWTAPFKSLLSRQQLVEFIILDVEPVSSEVTIDGSKYVLADAQVARVSDFGKNDTTFHTRTHLGNRLSPGDNALGYDLCAANCNNAEMDKNERALRFDVILVKKSYEEKRREKVGKPRPWKLKSLKMEVDDSTRHRADKERRDSEYEQFLRDLEENPEMRFNISLYRNKEYQPSENASMTDGEDAPSVPLEELLADLNLEDKDTEEEEDNMRE